jgi:hypothetical protein
MTKRSRPLLRRLVAAVATWSAVMTAAIVAAEDDALIDDPHSFWVTLVGTSVLILAVGLAIAVRRRSLDHLLGILIGLGAVAVTMITIIGLLGRSVSES